VVEVTAATLYEAVAQGLRIFRTNEWVDDLGSGTIIVTVRQPEVEHAVEIAEFEHWLASMDRSPAERSRKNRVREILGEKS
jgi:hypothetical protein